MTPWTPLDPWPKTDLGTSSNIIRNWPQVPEPGGVFQTSRRLEGKAPASAQGLDPAGNRVPSCVDWAVTGRDCCIYNLSLQICLLQQLPLIDTDLAAGDCMFIHCNLLHKSEANDSNHKRWNLILTYNAKSNNPEESTYNAFYGLHKLNRYPANAIKECQDLSIHQRNYLDPKTNPNIDTKAWNRENSLRWVYVIDCCIVLFARAQ